jgi:hypothetical protein
VLFFLLPTVVVFYLAFASARMLIISLKAALDTWLAFLNHFPLFALMLRVKDPGRLPGNDPFENLILFPSTDKNHRGRLFLAARRGYQSIIQTKRCRGKQNILHSS